MIKTKEHFNQFILLGIILAGAAACAVFFMRGEKAWTPGTPLSKERLTIGVIHIDGTAGGATSGYTYAHEQGIRAMQQALGISDSSMIIKAGIQDTDEAATEHAIHECAAAGANLIIATSWGYMDSCEKLAAEYPGVVFAHASGYKYNATNFTNYFGRVYQARYLSGMVAGLRTESGKIGYVAAMGKDNSEVTGGINAFALGVERVNPDARVHVRTTHRWFDPRAEAEAAKGLLAAGCDVIAQHCDTAGPSIEAEKKGAWGIGYNSDMKTDAPGAVLTSVVWDWSVYYTKLVRSLLDGSFVTTPYLGDLGDGTVGLTPLNESLLPPGSAAIVEEAKKSIESGAFGVFEGALEMNNGQTAGTPGTRFSDEAILRGMDWYYRNVVED